MRPSWKDQEVEGRAEGEFRDGVEEGMKMLLRLTEEDAYRWRVRWRRLIGCGPPKGSRLSGCDVVSLL